MTKYSRLGKNSLYIFIGNIGSKIIGFIMLPLYTKWLTVGDYGITDIAQVYQNFLIPLITLGLGEAIFLFPINADSIKRRKYLSTTCWTILICEIIFFGFYYLLPHRLTNLIVSESINRYSLYIICYIIISSFQLVLQQFARGIDQMKIFSYTGIINTFSMALFSVLLIPQYKLEGFFIAMILGNILSLIYTFIALKAYKYLELSIEKTSLLEMTRYALPLIPNATMWWIVSSINRPIMENYVGLEGIGLYAVANKFPSVINMVFFIFFGAWQVSAIEEFNKDGYSKFYNKIFRVVFFILIFLCFVMTEFRKPILSILVNERYISAASYIPLLCLGVLFANLSAFIGTTFTAIKQTSIFFKSSLLAAGVAVVGNYMLIPSIGVYGACISIILSQFCMFIYRWIRSRKYVRFEEPGKILLSFCLLACFISIIYFIPSEILSFWFSLLLFMIFLLINRDIMKEAIKLIIQKIKNERY